MTMTAAMAEAIVAGAQRATADLVGLTVLYDPRCPLCRRLREWLDRQATLVPVEFVAADSPLAHQRFPDLDHRRTTRVLTVVSRDGAVYEEERAWLVCGWALPSWQPVVERFGSGVKLRVARVGTRAIDGYRHRLLARSAPAGSPPPCESCY